jgi:hypothetical protein
VAPRAQEALTTLSGFAPIVERTLADTFIQGPTKRERAMRRAMHCVAATAMLLAGCAGISTNAQVSPGTNLAKYQTYGWYKPPSAAAESMAEQQLRASLEQQLAQKGLTPATTNPPDFLISYHAMERQKIEATPGYGYGGFGYGYGWGGYPAFTTYTEGTLIVDFIDPQTNKVFWRGTAKGVVDHPDNPDPQRIDQAAAKLINQYPAQLASAPRQAM